MKNKLFLVENLVGNTPLVKLQTDLGINLFAKLECNNLMGSVKVRPALSIIKSSIEKGEIDEETTVIESTSGNFGVALAILCNYLGIKFIPVIDPNINPSYENLLNNIAYKVVKVTKRDSSGGYLLSRIETVNTLLNQIENSFWPNQYSNPDNFQSHYYGLGKELADSFDRLDFAFIGVSSGGTISGVSKRLKEKFPNVNIVAVDVEGSVIFGKKPKKRYIPGLGSGKVPELLKEAVIDDIVHVNEVDAVTGCYQLLKNHSIFAGGSSGAIYYAVNKYFKKQLLIERDVNVVFICPDGGLPYVDTVYNKQWVSWLKEQV